MAECSVCCNKTGPVTALREKWYELSVIQRFDNGLLWARIKSLMVVVCALRWTQCLSSLEWILINYLVRRSYIRLQRYIYILNMHYTKIATDFYITNRFSLSCANGLKTALGIYTETNRFLSQVNHHFRLSLT